MEFLLIGDVLRQIRQFILKVCLISPLAWQLTAQAAKITGEKKCAVRIDGDAFSVGQFVGVYKDESTEKPIARIRILKVDKNKPTRSIGRVLRKPGKSCANLNGLTVSELSEKYLPTHNKQKSSTASSASALPKLEFTVFPGMESMTAAGLYTGADSTSVNVRSITIPVSLKVYPGQFFSSSFFAKSLGVGLSYAYRMTATDIPVETAGGSQAAQSVTGSTLKAGLQFRLAYMNEEMQTEIETSYVMNAIKSKLTKTPDDLRAAPLRDIATSGISFGVYQKFLFAKSILATVGGSYTYGLSASSPTSYNGLTEEQTSTYSGLSGFGALAKTEIVLGLFSGGLGYQFSLEQAKNKLTLTNTDDSSKTEGSADTKLTSHFIFLSLGTLF